MNMNDHSINYTAVSGNNQEISDDDGAGESEDDDD